MKNQSKYRDMSVEDLNKELISLSKERFNLRFQKVTGEGIQPHLLKQVKRNVARVKTRLREKEGL